MFESMKDVRQKHSAEPASSIVCQQNKRLKDNREGLVAQRPLLKTINGSHKFGHETLKKDRKINQLQKQNNNVIPLQRMPVNDLNVIQLKKAEIKEDRLNMVGETHTLVDIPLEKGYTADILGDEKYYFPEYAMKFSPRNNNGIKIYGDDPDLRFLSFLAHLWGELDEYATTNNAINQLDEISKLQDQLSGEIDKMEAINSPLYQQKGDNCPTRFYNSVIKITNKWIDKASRMENPTSNLFYKASYGIKNLVTPSSKTLRNKIKKFLLIHGNYQNIDRNSNADQHFAEIRWIRSYHMHRNANKYYRKKAIWKVGQLHVDEIRRMNQRIKYNLVD